MHSNPYYDMHLQFTWEFTWKMITDEINSLSINFKINTGLFDELMYDNSYSQFFRYN